MHSFSRKNWHTFKIKHVNFLVQNVVILVVIHSYFEQSLTHLTLNYHKNEINYVCILAVASSCKQTKWHQSGQPYLKLKLTLNSLQRVLLLQDNYVQCLVKQTVWHTTGPDLDFYACVLLNVHVDNRTLLDRHIL